MREDIVNHNGLYGVSATMIDGWDNDEIVPLQTTIDPLSIIPDPKNWRGSKMRFIGWERKVKIETLLANDAFDRKAVEKVAVLGTQQTSEDRQTEQAYNDAANTLQIFDEDGLLNIYDHFTIFDGKKWLTTWTADFNTLLRAVEIEPLSSAEKKNPSKVKFPVQLHRRKPVYGRFFGASIADEVLNYQDAISVLTNLQLIQARIAALGPDKMIDSNLGIDVSLLQNKLPG